MQENFFAKAGINWHQTVVIFRAGKIWGFVHAADESTKKATQVFFILCDVLKRLRETCPNIKKVIFQSDSAGCYHTLDLISRIAVSDMALEVLEWMFSEAQAGKDVCDRLIAPQKTCVRNYVKQEHDVETASQLCSALSTITTLRGDHCVIEYEPFDTASTPAIPGRKTNASKIFARWSEVWIRRNSEGVFTSLAVREQFEIGSLKELPAAELVNSTKLAGMQRPTFLRILGEGTMGAGNFTRTVAACKRNCVEAPESSQVKNARHKVPFSCHICCRLFFTRL